jgi:hypothetical protein
MLQPIAAALSIAVTIMIMVIGHSQDSICGLPAACLH